MKKYVVTLNEKQLEDLKQVLKLAVAVSAGTNMANNMNEILILLENAMGVDDV
jgi:hypothetical protein